LNENKKTIIETNEGDTQLTLKELAPVRLIKNKFYNDIQELYSTCPSIEDLKVLLGRARAKKGMFEGDLVEGELEIGQIAGLIHNIKSVESIINEVIQEFQIVSKDIQDFKF
jgi:enoyl-[acyl-carrier protein] reductase II